MFYKTEFEVSIDELSRYKDRGDDHLSYLKEKYASELGRLIATNIPFTKGITIPPSTESTPVDRYGLEIIVFSIKDWENFIRNIRNASNALEIHDEIKSLGRK